MSVNINVGCLPAPNLSTIKTDIMKIAIIGYGRMGHAVEEVARERGHSIVCTIDNNNTDMLESEAFRSADVAIEFSQPKVALSNILASFTAGVPIVCGTTGWLESMPSVRMMCDKGLGTLLWSSNFSIGVNVFKAVNRYMARLFDKFPQYSCSMEEVHHIHKLDHPSGTAITLAETIAGEVKRIDGWQEPDTEGAVPAGQLPVAHRREGEVPGIHTVTWDSEADTLTFTHSAKSRRGFALGAVLAAEWLKDRKPGLYTIDDMLGF